jgi:uncharacterized protein YkwD
LYRTRLLRAVLLACMVFMLVTTTAQAGSRRSMVRAINSVRGAQLRFSQKLSAGAAAWARHLFQAGYLGHSARAIACHQGEVIEWHTGTGPNVGGVVGEWMNSPEHRPVLLNGIWRKAGAGMAVGTLNGLRSTIWVVRFAR